jgi:hypothetical protein
MARAHNVYLVEINHHPIAAFTVKHECRKWLRNEYDGKAPSNLTVFRLKDGYRDEVVNVTGEIVALL